MRRFLLLYRGDVVPFWEMPVEEHDEVMDRWGAWLEVHGPDAGFPFGESAAVGADGSDQRPTNLSGYSVVVAESLAAAKELVRDHPALYGVGPEYAVEIFELLPI
jgi:hypothetical protein